MDRIRVQTLPDCESRQTSIWYFFAKEFGESSYEGKQMTVTVRVADAPSGIRCQKNSDAYRKGCYGKLSSTAGSSDKEWPLECLSRVMENYHARFLGGLGLVTAPGYPTSNVTMGGEYEDLVNF